jgi:glycosyltransferase XagB
VLLRLGAVAPDRLLVALALQPKDGRRLGDILVSRGWTSPEDLAAALALQHGADRADLRRAARPPPVDLLGPDACIRLGVVPWKSAGAATVVAASSLAARATPGPRSRPRWAPSASPSPPGLEVEEAVLAAAAPRSRAGPNSACPPRQRPGPRAPHRRGDGRGRHCSSPSRSSPRRSPRSRSSPPGPSSRSRHLTLRAAAGDRAARPPARARRALRLGPRRPSPTPTCPWSPSSCRSSARREIAGRLVERLARLDYPADRLDVCLAVEADDRTTREALARAALPPWMRQIVVPPGTVRTKPRALNYALDFCRGSIVGIYDAEDAPAPDQLRRVVRRFRESPPEVACLQGVLDFYNARTNWLSRCFAIDYATWFRIVLPGIARLGFVIPLGGTTLFFRRAALERLGGWDAHNVTEDADLGLRLARHGYRCELIDSVTEEEANCRAIPWIRQRSRWLKGYAMTWISHMRRRGSSCATSGPGSSWACRSCFSARSRPTSSRRSSGASGSSPSACRTRSPTLVPWWLFVALGTAFLVTELVNVAAGAFAVSSAKHRWLIPWVPTMHFYHPLGAVASWKALIELVVRPFYWDKTAHGLYGPERGSIPREPLLPRRAEDGSRTPPRYAP